MKRVLIVSYYWPPTGGSGVQRWVKFAKYLPSFGWQPVIYTPENPEQLARDESLLKEIPEEVEVIRTPIREPYEIYRRLSGKKNSTGQASEVNPLNSGRKSFKQKLAVWVRGNLFVPDPRAGWVAPSVRFLKKYLEEHPVDVVVTTGPPQSMHLIGRNLKRTTGIRWIADFRDPWTQMFYFKHMGLWPLAERRHRKLEKSVLDEADGIISVTPLVQQDFQAMTTTPVHLITNGFDEDDFPAGERTQSGESFSIVHTGLFASDGNPELLWQVLRELCEENAEFGKALKIRLIGKTDKEIGASLEASGLKDKVELCGYLDHALTVSAQRDADMLILPLRKEPEYRKVLPGKIFEYLASGRPVLGIGQEDGAAATVLRDCGAGEMYDWNRSSELKEFILKVWKEHQTGESVRGASDISRYTRRALTGELVKIL